MLPVFRHWGFACGAIPIAIGALAMLVCPRSAFASACDLVVNIDGADDAASWKERLLDEARTQKACHSGWRLTVSVQAKGRHKIVLETGASPETRTATSRQDAEDVIALLFRVAVEREPNAATEKAAIAPSDTTPVTSGVWHAGFDVRAGAMFSDRAGAGPALGVGLLYGTRQFGVGVAPMVAWIPSARSELELPLVARAAIPVGQTVSMGAELMLGASGQRATASEQGRSQTRTSFGLLGGVAPYLGIQAGSWSVGLLIPIVYSSAHGEAGTFAQTTTTTKGNNGNDKTKTTTTTVVSADPAGASAADRLGGLSVSALVVVGLPL